LEPASGFSGEDVLQKLASVERASEHPLAMAIVSDALERKLALAQVTDFDSPLGKGVIGTVEGQLIVSGSAKFLAEHRIETSNLAASAEVLRQQAASHLVLCTLDDVAGVERIYPGKVFELMALGRPCLTLAPRGVLAELVERHRLGPVIAPRDEEAIAAALADALRRFRAGTYRNHGDAVDLERFHRRRLAGEFAEVFRAARAAALAR
jgi:glycosyltransferase involved in cell wall biosynthesis